MPTGASVGRTEQLVRPIEQALDKEPVIESVFALSGGQAFAVLERELDRLDTSSGYCFEFGGQAELMRQMQRTILIT